MKKSLFPLFLLLTLLTSCGSADLVENIFTTHPWHLMEYYYTPDWNGSQSNPVPFEGDYVTGFDLHTIYFNDNGQCTIYFPNHCVVTGTWFADGSTREMHFSSLRFTQGSAAALDVYSQKMFARLQTVGWYRGDSNVLALFDDDRHNFMQFENAEIIH